MRGSKAKKLRKQARALSQGMPARGYEDIKHRITVYHNNKPQTFIGIQLLNHPKTTRGVYLRLKKGLAA